jgi:hypothetical protein
MDGDTLLHHVVTAGLIVAGTGVGVVVGGGAGLIDDRLLLPVGAAVGVGCGIVIQRMRHWLR